MPLLQPLFYSHVSSWGGRQRVPAGQGGGHAPKGQMSVGIHGVGCSFPPLLVPRRLLPALVGGSWSDQLHVGTEVLAAGAGALAGAPLVEAEILGGGLLKPGEGSGPEIATPVADFTPHSSGILHAPETIPVRQTLARRQRLGVPAARHIKSQETDRLGVDVGLLTPSYQAPEKGLGVAGVQRPRSRQ